MSLHVRRRRLLRRSSCLCQQVDTSLLVAEREVMVTCHLDGPGVTAGCEEGEVASVDHAIAGTEGEGERCGDVGHP